MNAYRSSLIATFTNVTALPNDEFHRVLAGTQNAALDAALRDVRLALRDVLEAAAASLACSAPDARSRASCSSRGSSSASLGISLIGIATFSGRSRYAGRHRGLAGRDHASRAEHSREPNKPARSPFMSHSITWPALVDPDAGELDEGERRRVLDGLGIVGDAWCAGILAKAFDEEEGDLRVAAIESLGQCDAEIVDPTLERAYSSYAIAERYAAIDGASRRGDIALLERALRDTDGTVALAAAYGLHRAERDDLIDNNLATRTDPRANEIGASCDSLYEWRAQGARCVGGTLPRASCAPVAPLRLLPRLRRSANSEVPVNASCAQRRHEGGEIAGRGLQGWGGPIALRRHGRFGASGAWKASERAENRESGRRPGCVASERPGRPLSAQPTPQTARQIGGILRPKYSAMMCCAIGAAT